MEQSAEGRTTFGQWIAAGVFWFFMEAFPALIAFAFSLFLVFLLYRGFLTLL